MNKVITLAVLSLVTLALLIVSSSGSYNKGTYVDQQVLDTASPMNVSIDIEFLQKLNPAYE